LRVQRSNGQDRFEVTADGAGLTGRAGTAALRELADRLGVGEALEVAARAGGRRRRHRPGAVLRDVAVVLADGGDDFSAVEVLRSQTGVFGDTPSDSTAWRAVAGVAADELGGARLDAARKQVRAAAWSAGAEPAVVTAARDQPLDAEPVCVDIDATLLTAHSDKQQSAGNYKGGYGFHPLAAWLDRGDGTGETLAALLRPGNAGASTAVDHIDVLEIALDQIDGLLPDDAQVLIRADSAGATKEFCGYVRACGAQFSMSFRTGETVKDVIRTVHADPAAWTTAVRVDGSERDGAAVAELTDLVDLGHWPDGARLLVRREPLHPGAQQTLDDIDGQRFTCFLTDQPTADLAVLDLRHRGHARVEQRIKNLKDTGWGKLPSADYAINQVWVQLATLAADLLTFFAALCLDGPLAVAEPKTVRYRLLHVAARLTRHSRRARLRIDTTWPWADQLVAAFARLRALPATLP
jgi:hypothetical protein